MRQNLQYSVRLFLVEPILSLRASEKWCLRKGGRHVANTVLVDISEGLQRHGLSGHLSWEIHRRERPPRLEHVEAFQRSNASCVRCESGTIRDKGRFCQEALSHTLLSA
jgi:hypothetical protein